MNTLDIEAKLAQEYGYKPLPKEVSEKSRQKLWFLPPRVLA